MVQSGHIQKKVLKPFDVFVSHSSKDVAKATAVVATLEQDGVRCWIAPRNIVPGSQYGEAILRGIENCQLMVLVFSSHANESPQIMREVERAVHHGMKIIPFRIENVNPSKNLEYFISSPHWLDAYSGSFASHLSYLNKTVKHQLGHSDATGAPIHSGVFKIGKNYPLLLSRLTTPTLKFCRNAWKPAAVVIALSFAAVLGTRWLLYSPVDEALVGKWQMTVSDLPLVGLPAIRADGSYEMTLAFQESGIIEIRNGAVFLKPKSGRERRIAWEPIDDSSVTSTIIPDEFWDLTARITPERRLEFETRRNGTSVWTKEIGQKRLEILRWKFAPQADDFRWSFWFETGPGSAYRFRAVENDKGTIRTKDSRWTMTSEKAGVKSGQYQVINENTVSLSTPLGQATWKR